MLGLAIAGMLIISGCRPKDLRMIGSSCDNDTQCASQVCIENVCADPLGDADGDGLTNGDEKTVFHTSPTNADTDNDGISDGEEVGYPEEEGGEARDTDGDGKIDALESNILDEDKDCLPDQVDPHNDTPDEPDMGILVEAACLKGICRDHAGDILATCENGRVICDFSKVTGWSASETECDGLDNDCDGLTDEDWPKKGDDCTVGTGACENTGKKVCTADGKGLTCSVNPKPAADKETCDNLIDDDCNGVTDDYCGRVMPLMVNLRIPMPTRAGGSSGTVSLYQAAACKDGTVTGAPAKSVVIAFEKSDELDAPAGLYCMQVTADGYESFVSDIFDVRPLEMQSATPWAIDLLLDPVASADKTINITGQIYMANNQAVYGTITTVKGVATGGKEFDVNYQAFGDGFGYYSLGGLNLAVDNMKFEKYVISIEYDAGAGLKTTDFDVNIDTGAPGYPSVIFQDFLVK